MTRPATHERQEAQAVEISLALLAGVATFVLLLVAGWGLTRLGVTVPHVEWPIAGVLGIVTTLARLIQVRRNGL
jgi:hydrogenase/urease accessory protein HupE